MANNAKLKALKELFEENDDLKNAFKPIFEGLEKVKKDMHGIKKKVLMRIDNPQNINQLENMLEILKDLLKKIDGVNIDDTLKDLANNLKDYVKYLIVKYTKIKEELEDLKEATDDDGKLSEYKSKKIILSCKKDELDQYNTDGLESYKEKLESYNSKIEKKINFIKNYIENCDENESEQIQESEENVAEILDEIEDDPAGEEAGFLTNLWKKLRGK